MTTLPLLSLRLHQRVSACVCFILISLSAMAADVAAITDAECEEFGTQLADYYSTDKHAEVVRQLDSFAFVKRVLNNLGLDEKEENEFRAGLLSSLSKTFTQQFKTFSSARYLRAQSVDGEKRVLLRCVSEAGAVNYFAFVVDRRASGSLKWVDVFIYLTGEKISETMHRALLPIAANNQKSLLDKLTSRESDYIRNFPKITKATQLIREKKHKEALAELDQLPADMKSQRFVLTLRLGAAQEVSEEAYLKVITEWEKTYPGDTALDLVSIDGDLLRKDYPRAIRRVEQLSARLGGDTYQTFLKGNIQMLAGQYDEARRSAREVLAAEPTLTSAWDTLLNVSLREKNYADTAAVLVEFEAAYPTAKMKEAIATNEAYADFRTSAEYRTWAGAKESPAKDNP